MPKIIENGRFSFAAGGDQFEKADSVDGGVIERGLRFIELGDIADAGNAFSHAFPQTGRKGRVPIEGIAFSPLDDVANPIDESHARRAQRLR